MRIFTKYLPIILMLFVWLMAPMTIVCSEDSSSSSSVNSIASATPSAAAAAAFNKLNSLQTEDAPQEKPVQPIVHYESKQIENEDKDQPEGQQVAPMIITTTTPAPPPEPQVPDYLKNCFYAEEELCLNWYNNSEDKNENGLGNGVGGAGGTARPEGAALSTSNASSGSVPSSSSSDDGLLTAHLNITNIPNRDINSCQCRLHPTKANSWYCCNITHITMISSCSNIKNWTNLHVRNMTMKHIDLTNSIYRLLQSMAFTDGNITSVIKSFPRYSSMKCLNISNNNIADISLRAVKNAAHLEFLDISNNNLSRVPNWNQNSNMTMDISGNMRMLCEPLNEAINSDSFKFVNPEKSFCLYNATHQWFNSTDLVSIKQLERTKQCRTKCPIIPGYGNCTCYHIQIMIIQGDQSKPICHVDCANLGLVELPSRLPDNTFTLNIANNSITSLGDHFRTNPTYHNIVKLIADDNKISSIYEFEGTKFIEHFQRIYMRNNSLSKIPEYFLNNALMDTEIGRRIYLAGNKLQCDCNSAKTLQNWLKERSSDIPDYMEIKCRNLPQSVIELQETKLCQAPPDWTDYIYYLIAAEVLLLLALITKVSYDYWIFKTAGYLPWPASKMPKLPCDWLCES